MSMVWPCPLTAGAYASAGRAVKVPRPECPSCSGPVVSWSGYWRHVRWQRQERKIFIPRVRCCGCGVTHALLPAFVLARRLDAAESAGAVIVQVAGGACGVRLAAAAAGVPHTTARGWVRRFAARAGELAVSFSALAVELGGEVVRLLPDPLRSAVAAIARTAAPRSELASRVFAASAITAHRCSAISCRIFSSITPALPSRCRDALRVTGS